MKCNKIFLFPIQTKDLSFHFRLLKLSILPEVDMDKTCLEMILNQTKSKIASRIWKQNTHGAQNKWSALIKIKGEPYIAIPTNIRCDGVTIPFPKMNRTVSLSDTGRIYSFCFNEPEPLYQDLAIRWLEDNLRIILEQHGSQLWNLGNFYFLRQAINLDNLSKNKTIDIFPGFSLKVYPRNDKEYALCVSDCVKYVDARPLKWYIDQGISIRQKPPRHGIYKNGSNWYEIQILGETGASISKTIIPAQGTSVYQYIKRDASNRPDIDVSLLVPDTPSFEYQYPNKPENKYFANTAWAYFTFGTNDPKVRHLHSLSKKKPEERLENVQKFVEKFLSQSALKIFPRCETATEEHFPIPTLVYGNNHKLRVDSSNTSYEEAKDNTTIVRITDWFASKKRILFQQGAYKKGIVLPQHLIIPDSMDPIIGDTFQDSLAEVIKNITKMPYQFTSVNTYSVHKKTTSLSGHYQAIEQVIKEQNLLCDQDATIVLVLPARDPSVLHDHLKALFEKERVRSQFLVESYPDDRSKFGVCDFFAKDITQRDSSYTLIKSCESRYKSYVQNIAFGILMNNCKWLYRLDKPLHHDLIIGVDISNRMVGLSLYDGKHGNLIFTFDFSGKTIKDRRYRVEKLNENVMAKLIYNFLKEGITKLQLNAKSIVIHRDGRAFDSEWIGFSKAISELQKEDYLDSDVNFGIVEIYKSSVSLPRIVRSWNGKIENPQMGKYEFINDHEAILCNTGFPAKLDGTAHPLLVRHRFGNINFQHALHDVFDLSNLCYAAPDKPQSLPITLKIIDDLLTPLAYDIESPGYEESEEEQLEKGEDIDMISYSIKSRIIGAGL